MLKPYADENGSWYYDEESINAPVSIGIGELIVIGFALASVLMTGYIIAIAIGGI